MTTELWNAKRKKLEANLIEAALSLSEHTGSHGFAIPVPGTTPAVSVSMGALAASGGNAAPIDPTVQGMADCMHMVQQELIEADAIPGGTAPMFIANEVVRKMNSYKRENLELKRVYEARGEQIKRLDIALDRAASAPNAALVAALKGALAVIDDYLAYTHDGDPWKEDARSMGEMDINDADNDGRIESWRAALSAAGQEVGHG